MSDYVLDETEAFRAMGQFVLQFDNRAGGDLLTLLGDIHIQDDGGPTDPAAWDGWLESVRLVKGAPPGV